VRRLRMKRAERMRSRTPAVTLLLLATGLFFGLLFLTSPPASTSARRRDDLRALQGTWVLQTVEWLGEKTEQDATLDTSDLMQEYRHRLAEERALPQDRTRYRTTLSVKANAFEFRQSGRVSAVGHFRLHLGRTPKVMERRTTRFTYFIHDVSCSRFADTDTYFCIYSLEGNTLKWCQREGTDAKGLSAPASLKALPATFATGQDEDVYLLTFKRERR
jgi:hypothetical protein